MSDKNNLINQCLYCDHCKNKMKYILSDLNSYSSSTYRIS